MKMHLTALRNLKRNHVDKAVPIVTPIFHVDYADGSTPIQMRFLFETGKAQYVFMNRDEARTLAHRLLRMADDIS